MRSIFIFTSIGLLILVAILIQVNPYFIYLLILVLPYILLGVYDMIQKESSIRRNFPVIGRFRYLMQDIRPMIHQYFVESDTYGTPFNKLERDLVYNRSENKTSTRPFGTQLDVYEPGYEWINHSMQAKVLEEIDPCPRVRIGSPQCTQPYDAALYNISAMSYGSLSKNAIIALNEGAQKGGFYHNTGEGGLTPYHLQGGDVVWNIGTGYFSCRNEDGSFSYEEYVKRATKPTVKMIELKMSQGAKPGHGGILPKSKVTQEIADIRLVKTGGDVVSPPRHSAFSTPDEMMYFIQKLREGSGGKPIGIKLCVGQKSEFIAICQAMVENQVYLDFITVDGGEGGTGAAPIEYSDHVGMPLRDAIAFVHDTLKGFGLKKHTKIIASGKVITGFDIVKCLSIGADLCNSARGMMFALGCIQALECNLNTCPAGVATQNPQLVKGLNIKSKAETVAEFQRETVKAAMEMIASAGLEHPDDVDRSVVSRRIDRNNIETFENTYPEVIEGSLL